MTEAHYERLSGQDLSFLAIEDGRAHMHIGMVSIFEAEALRLDHGGIDFDSIQAYIAAQLHHTPRLRQKLAWVPGIGQAVWVDDPNFNIHFHVRHAALPPPGDIRQLKRLAARIMSQELDRGKPLWEHWIVDNVEDDCFALISKVHHCMVDGVSGLAMISSMIRAEPDQELEPPVEWAARPAPGDTRLLVDELRHRTVAPVEFLTRQLRRYTGGSSPSLGGLQQFADIAMSGTGETPLNQPIGPHRRFDWTRFPFEEVHDVAVAAGGKVNDVVLAVTTGALRGFFTRRGLDLDERQIRVWVPVNVRAKDDEAMGNQVSGLIVDLPIHEPHPQACLDRIIAITSELKSHREPQITDSMYQVIELLPPSLVGPFFRRGSRATPTNLAVSNVSGPHVPVYLFGARQLAMYPALPLIGNQTLGIALMSYDDSLCWGINADWDAVPDLHDFVELLESSFAHLREAVAV